MAEVKRLLQLPANPDDLSPTAVRSPPIFIAARHGDPGAADVLIRAGADPTCFSVLRNASLGNAPLHTAVQHPDGAIVQILCRARADLNAVDGKGAPSGIDTSISCVCWRVHVRTLTTFPPMTIAATTINDTPPAHKWYAYDYVWYVYENHN